MPQSVPFEAFVLGPSEGERFYRASIVSAGAHRLDGRLERAVTAGAVEPPGEIVCTITSGTEAPDFLANARQLPVISKRIADAFTAASLTGFATYPVTVVTRDGKNLEYAGLILRGRGGSIDATAAQTRMELATGLRVRSTFGVAGLNVDASQWDGNDVFHLDEFPLVPLVTQKVLDLLGSLRPRGLAISPASAWRA